LCKDQPGSDWYFQNLECSHLILKFHFSFKIRQAGLRRHSSCRDLLVWSWQKVAPV
jgi:hypothetical protein